MLHLRTIHVIYFLAGMFLAVAPARAQIVIDQFLNNTGSVLSTNATPYEDTAVLIDGQSATRRLSASATGTFSLETMVTSSILVVDGGGTGTGSADAQAEYLGESLALGGNFYFEMVLNTVIGTPTVFIMLQSSGAPGTLSGGASLSATTTGYSVFFDLREMSGYTPAFLTGVNDILIGIGGANENFFVEAQSLQFSPVPEPSRLALLAVASLALASLRVCRSGRRFRRVANR